VFQRLWGNVADDLRATLARAIGDIGRAIYQHAGKGEDEAVENVARRMARLGEWKGQYRPAWGELSEEKREHYRERAGVHPSAEILAAQAKGGLLRGRGEDLYSLAQALAGAGKTAEQKESAKSEAQKEATQSLTEFTTALAEAREQLTQLLGAAGQEVRETLPRAKSPEQIAADQRGADVAAARQSPEYKRREAGLAKKRHNVELLRKTTRQDYHERAAELEAEIALAVEGEAQFLETVIERMGEQRDAIRANSGRLDRADSRIRNLGTSRTR